MRHGQGDPINKGEVRSSIRMLIPLDKQSAAIEILGSVSAQVQFDPSCISSQIYRGVDDVRAIMVEELWSNDEDIMRHLNSDVYRRVLLVIEMSEEPPEIRFDIIAGTSGVETIEMARNQNEANDKISILP